VHLLARGGEPRYAGGEHAYRDLAQHVSVSAPFADDLVVAAGEKLAIGRPRHCGDDLRICGGLERRRVSTRVSE
jgi:hypothetical protein